VARKTILSGIQPTGDLHIGNYEGALKNWVKLQDEDTYDMFCCIVDWHALTAEYENTKDFPQRIFQAAVNYLAAGLDPEKSSIFVQSKVKEHAELHLLFSMIIPIPWLERVPSYKEKSKELNLDSYGFLGYPLLQAADILVYRAHFVPVGKDQLPHIELTQNPTIITLRLRILLKKLRLSLKRCSPIRKNSGAAIPDGPISVRSMPCKKSITRSMKNLTNHVRLANWGVLIVKRFSRNHLTQSCNPCVIDGQS